MTILLPENELRAKFIDLRDALNARHFERLEAVDVAVTALLCRYHAVLIGAPGTGKSALTRDLAAAIDDADYYERLITRFTTPEELFGPLSISGLQRDVYERLVDGYLPTAKVVFLDEIFKASAALLNTTLTAMNERVFHNGRKILEIPLQSLFGASNELPDGEELGALFDRFHFRLIVDYIHEPRKFMSMLLKGHEGAPLPTITHTELEQAQAAVAEVTVTESALDTLLDIRTECRRDGIVVSDRRWRQSIRALQATAWLDDATEIIDDHFGILQHILWRDPAEQKKVTRIILNRTNPIDVAAQELVEELVDIEKTYRSALSDRDRATNIAAGKEKFTRVSIELFSKCRDIGKRLTKLGQDADRRGRSSQKVEVAKDRLGELFREIGMEAIGMEEDLFRP